jgi:transposase InsO family protein
MAYKFMREHRNEYAVRETAGIFGVSGSACCRWMKKGVCGRRQEGDAELADMIRRMQKRHHYQYGSPRVREAPRRDCGKRTSPKKAAALMWENGLNARGRRKFIPTTNSNHGFAVCDNVLSREFHAERPGEKRVSDITCLRAREAGRV